MRPTSVDQPRASEYASVFFNLELFKESRNFFFLRLLPGAGAFAAIRIGFRLVFRYSTTSAVFINLDWWKCRLLECEPRARWPQVLQQEGGEHLLGRCGIQQRFLLRIGRRNQQFQSVQSV